MAKQDAQKAYRAKRNFCKTAEPSGKSKQRQSGNPIFVIQQHDASRLHYDFRLEVDGVLKSWAVPKGPSTDSRHKRLAVPTEAHPMDYADFEGVIPEGEYGAGTVIVWDRGPYQNLKQKDGDPISMSKAIDDGHVEIWLEGEKLKGGYALIRTRGKDDRWLLIKMKDDEADARRNPVSTEPQSVLSGKILKEIAQEANASAGGKQEKAR